MSEREQNGVVILEPKGKIMGGPDAGAVRERLHQLIDDGKKKVVVDLSGVSWMNSSGLGILIGGLTTMRNSGGDLKLANTTEKVQNLLMVTKLISIFESYDTVDDAVASYL
ncbi:STAS domain-containing protein [bacterium]|nr:STAS domain-containing protein [bacterium]